MNQIHDEMLRATEFLDSDSSTVGRFVERVAGFEGSLLQRCIALYYAVREELRYEVYDVCMSRSALKASSILESGSGFCIHKAIVFSAAARRLGIPSRLGFADVRNHLATGRLKKMVGGDVFHYHAYSEVHLENRWVKATPAFNEKFCRLFGVAPLDFDGKTDSVLQPQDRLGRRHMEFLRDRGTHNDFPYEDCVRVLRKEHPLLFGNDATARGNLVEEAAEDG